MSQHDDFARAAEWLRGGAKAFWRWSDDGEAVLWARTEATVAFREQVYQLVSALDEDTLLPPFYAVVLLLAATRRQGFDDADDGIAGTDLPPTPVDLRGIVSNVARGRLARHLLAADRAPGPPTALASRAVVLRALEAGLPAELLRIEAPAPAGAAEPFYAKSWRDCLRGLDPESLRRLVDTGIVEAPLPADLDVETRPAAGNDKLLDELEREERFEGIVALARRCQAAVALPRPLQVEDDRSSGGVGGITNRGALDRLLISEFAHDEELFLLRLAQGEALYREPEIARHDTPHDLHVVLDSGIRAWGRPRLFAIAIALGLQDRGPDNRAVARIRCWTTDGSRAREHSFDEPTAAVDALLAHTSVDRHPGGALPSVAEVAGRADDWMVVVARPAVRDPEFRARLAGLELERPPSLVTVTADGDLEVLQPDGQGGYQRERSARLPLDLLERRRRRKPPTSARRDRQTQYPGADLPVPLAMDRTAFPLRLGFRGGASAFCPRRGHAWIDRAGNFWLAEDPRHGGRQIPGQFVGAKWLAWEQGDQLLVSRGVADPCHRITLAPVGEPGLTSDEPRVPALVISEAPDAEYPAGAQRRPNYGEWTTHRTLSGRVRRIGASGDQLVFVDHKGLHVGLGIPMTRRHRNRRAAEDLPLDQSWHVQSHLGGKHRPYPLTPPAKGGALWIDSRGILHMVPADPDIPELAIVVPFSLDVTLPTGWSSAEERFGDSWFHDPGQQLLPSSTLLHRVAAVLETYR